MDVTLIAPNVGIFTLRQPYSLHCMTVAKRLASMGNTVRVITSGDSDVTYYVEEVEVTSLNASTRSFFKHKEVFKRIRSETDVVCSYFPVICSAELVRLGSLLNRPLTNVIFTDKITAQDLIGSFQMWAGGIGAPNFEGYFPYNLARLCYPDSALQCSLRSEYVSRFIVPSEHLRSRIIGRSPSRYRKALEEKITVIRGGVDTKAFDPKRRYSSTSIGSPLKPTSKDRVILFFGSDLQGRGLTDLVEAVSHVKREMKVKLVALVAGPKSAGLAWRCAQKLSLSEDTLIVNNVLDEEDLAAYLQLADVIALPFRHYWSMADSPFVLFEGMSMGKPVITTRLGAIPELIESGVTGILYDPRNSALLWKILIRLLEKPYAMRLLGENARQKAVQDYDWGRVTQAMEKTLESVLSG